MSVQSTELLSPPANPAKSDTPVVIEMPVERGVLSNAYVVSLLKSHLKKDKPAEKIKKILEHIAHYSTWKKEEISSCSSPTCGWRKWTLMTANTFAVAAVLAVIAEEYWASASDLGKFCLITANCIGDFGAPVLLPWLESEVAQRIAKYYFTGKHEQMALKTRMYIQQLKLFGKYNFDPVLSGKALWELGIHSIAEPIVRKMNASQLIRFLKELGSSRFEEYAGKLLSDSQKIYISFIEQLPTMTEDELISSLKLIQKYIPNDFSLFGEIVDAIHETHGQSDRIDNILLGMGKNLGIMGPDASVDEFGRMSIHIKTKSGLLASNLEVHRKAILQNEKLEGLLKGNGIEIWLHDEDQNECQAYEVFFRFMEGKKVRLTREIIIPLLAISDRYNEEKCARLCYEYLVRNQDAFEEIFFFDHIFKHIRFLDGIEKSKELLQEKISRKLKEKDYAKAEQLLQAAKRYRVDVREVTIVSTDEFSSILNYSVENDCEMLTEACVSFFEKCRGDLEVLAEIFSQWPPGKMPKILF